MAGREFTIEASDGAPKLRLGILCDGRTLKRWQVAALEQIAGCEFVVYNCRNSPAPKRRFRNLFYYFLAAFTTRNPLTRRIPIDALRPHVLRIFDFESDNDGAWQSLPDGLLRQIERDRSVAILKFGMLLLRVPGETALAPPILSYHHGDPEEYRGRPAGFYEMLHGRRHMGQIIQILTNRIDAGRVLAFAETRIHSHSYRKTLMEAYRHSPLLLRQALRNIAQDNSLEKPPTGPNYRLPNNLAVLTLVACMTRRLLARLWYGAFLEKRWRVARLKMNAPIDGAAEDWIDQIPSVPRDPVAIPAGYRFIADPFYHPKVDKILVEALSRATGKGELVAMSGSQATRLSAEPGHFSYPSAIDFDGDSYIVPETAQWASPTAFAITATGLVAVAELDIPGRPRLLDPTLLRHGGRIYLFGNDRNDGSNVLRLWSAVSLLGRFDEHPLSPIRISPRGARMAGSIIPAADSLVRPGQDGTGAYGDGIFLFRISEIDEARYSEHLIGEVRFPGTRGPHTMNFRGTEAVVDHYDNHFSLFAGVRRLRDRLA